MTDFAYITLTLSEDAAARILFNGFPLLETMRPARMQWMDILNLYMLRDNTLSIEIAAPADVAVKGSLRLSRHAQGSIVSPDTGLRLQAEMRDATGAPIAQEPDGTFTLSGTGTIRAEARFATFGPDFTTRLRPDTALNPDQAMGVALAALRGLEQGNLDAVISLMDPMIQDAALVWQNPVFEVRATMRDGLTFLAQGLPTEGLEYTLSPRPIGPLVEVLRDGGPLFQSMDGSTNMNAVFGWAAGGITLLR